MHASCQVLCELQVMIVPASSFRLCNTTLQALTKQDEQIEELESAAQEMQQQLAAANKSVEQYASSMQKVRPMPCLWTKIM